MYAVVVVGIVATTLNMRRATAGVSGRSRREERIAAGPWVVMGAAVAGNVAARENWVLFGTAVAILLRHA